MKSPTDSMSFLKGVELFGLFAGRGAAEAGADRVYEDQVGLVEERIVVVDQAIGGRRGVAVVVGEDALWPQQPQMQPHRRGAGAAVEGEGDGAGGRVGVVFGIGNEKDGCFGLFALGFLFFFVFFFEDKCAGGGAVGDFTAVQYQAVASGDDFFFRGGILFFFFRLGFSHRFPPGNVRWWRTHFEVRAPDDCIVAKTAVLYKFCPEVMRRRGRG
jgi:hypothetical protein